MRNHGNTVSYDHEEENEDEVSMKKRKNDEEEEEDDGKKKKKKKKEQQNKVAFYKLFAFADFYDYFLMSFGSIGACIHGASVPVFFIFFGKLINIIGMAYLFPEDAAPKVAKVPSFKFSLFSPHFYILTKLFFFFKTTSRFV